jgi:TolB-like protein
MLEFLIARGIGFRKGGLHMKERSFTKMLIFGFTWVLLTSASWAGQVVTQDVRLWAKGAIEQEQALGTISAPNTVAVLYFDNKTGLPDLDLLQKGLALMLMTDLSKLKEIQVVERVKIQALSEELGLGVSGLVEPETAPRMGKLLGAEHVVGGDILKEKADEFLLNSNLLKVPAEEFLGQPKAEGKLLEELFRMEKDLLFEIVAELEIELTPEQEADLRKPLTTSLAALLLLFEGVQYSDGGGFTKAYELYQGALKQDPNLLPAQEAMQELQQMGLVQAPAAAGAAGVAGTAGLSTAAIIGVGAAVAAAIGAGAAALGGGGGGGGPVHGGAAHGGAAQ